MTWPLKMQETKGMLWWAETVETIAELLLKPPILLFKQNKVGG